MIISQMQHVVISRNAHKIRVCQQMCKGRFFDGASLWMNKVLFIKY